MKRPSCPLLLYLALLLSHPRSTAPYAPVNIGSGPVRSGSCRTPRPQFHPSAASPPRAGLVLLGKRKKRPRPPPTPPTVQTPYGPVRCPLVKIGCGACFGLGGVRCPTCGGAGAMRKGAATGKRNSMPPKGRLGGSKFTSVEKLNGHRHYYVKELRGAEVILQNACGEPKEHASDVKTLKDKSVWRTGWVTLEEIKEAEGGRLNEVVKVCFRCKGSGAIECKTCYGEGEVYRD
eukprot:CAMPEP_0182461488 /NCGR_PEP_ID=MMETSP1319-20130603/6054_1 /TAXON_ID=172717 /ORGANISM="Bolidomonas pacifica, Strain RCC208" /LENGTH=232 /DNA_ID=CAMNT_0024660781 /DNA_START=95 /DNA_END=790 /DNA_ORIENTATION=+